VCRPDSRRDGTAPDEAKAKEETMTNYFIIGADGREYGPASVDDLQQWVNERRANARSKVRREGEGAWVTLGEVPELATLVGSADGQKGTDRLTPPPVPGPGEELAETIIRREPTLNIGDAFARGWDLLVDHPGLLIGATALVALLVFGVGSIPVVGVATALAFLFVLLGGLNLVFLKYLRGESADIGVVFAGFSGPLFVPLLLAGVIASALSFLGLLLCIVPGVYLIVCWAMYAPLLIADKRLDFWQALECSRRVVTRYWWPHFGLFMLGLLVVLAGVVACVIGVFVAMPLAFAAIVVAYEETFGEPDEEPTPARSLLPEPVSPEPSPEAVLPEPSPIVEPSPRKPVSEGSGAVEKPQGDVAKTAASAVSDEVKTAPSPPRKRTSSGKPQLRTKRVILRRPPEAAAAKAKRVRRKSATRPRRTPRPPKSSGE
jgi:uncharacterized membrane protein